MSRADLLPAAEEAIPVAAGTPPRQQALSRKALVAFACLYFFWGSTYTAIHVAGEHLAPPLVAASRTTLTTLLLVVICLVSGRSLRVTAAEAWRLVLVGVLMMTCNNILLTWAETAVPTGISSLLVATMPIMVAVLETVLPGGETLTARGWAGVLLGTGGMVVLVSPSLRAGAPAGGRHLLAYGLLLLAAFAFGLGAVLGRRFAIRRDVFVVTAWEVGGACLTNWVIALGGGTLRTAHWTVHGTLSIVYLSVCGSLVGLTCLSYLLQHVPVTKVTTYAFVNPIVAVLLGVVLLGERLSRAEVLGMALIVMSVALVIFSKVSGRQGQPVQDDLAGEA